MDRKQVHNEKSDIILNLWKGMHTMLFNSYIFVLFFLPLCIAGYFWLNQLQLSRWAQIFLLVMSLWFYGYFHAKYLWVIIGSVLFNYLFYKLLRLVKEKSIRKMLLISSMFLNLGLLFYFKYFNFFICNINALLKLDIQAETILLPLGISFFTFQQISFIADTYRGGVVRECGFVEYASFVTFFPQLIAGPIVTYDELIPQFQDDERKRFQWGNFARGIYIFVLGLAKKVLLADTFGNAANWGFSNIGELDSTNAIFTMLSYTIQIYFDFSGYCDMAVGIGKMMNIDLPLNFNSPYKARTITEFWERWHMTLTRFFTKYIYIPLKGNHGTAGRTYCNIMIVFLISGLWHGANWTFILWGVCHGIASVISRCFQRQIKYMYPGLSWIFTFSFVTAAWTIFRAESVRDAWNLFRCVAILKFGNVNENIINCFNLPELIFLRDRFHVTDFMTAYPWLFMVSFFVLAILLVFVHKNAYEKMQEFVPTTLRAVTIAVLLVWCICSFSGVSTFLYFNF